ncbi:MAG: hypothetical protein V3V10_04390 [Planctomycetota bacterium]
MSKIVIALILTATFAGALAASGAIIQLKNNKSHKAYSITSETLSGIGWEEERRVKGKRLYIWDVEVVLYDADDMDEYNGLKRKLDGGRGIKLAQDAKTYLAGAVKPEKLTVDEWARIQLQAQYFYAQGLFLQDKYDDAIEAFETYIKDAKAAAKAEKVGGALQSKNVAGYTNVSSLNRFFLDALEGLGLAHLKKGQMDKASKDALTPLEKICDSFSGRTEYYEWSIRALRAAAEYAESVNNPTDARKYYEKLEGVALRKAGGKASRESIEANLKVGFMLVAEGDTRAAKSRFYKAIKAWENQTKNQEKSPKPPKKGWINKDVAYETAGAYVGQGLVLLKDGDKTEDYTEALEMFSKSIALFNADDTIRSKAILGAARASQLLHDAAKKKSAKEMYGKWAARYILELDKLHGDSNAIDHEWMKDIRKVANKYA